MRDCNQENIPVTDNTSVECEELISTKCLIHEDALPLLSLPSGSTAKDVVNKINSILTTFSLRQVVNLEFDNEITLTVNHNRGYYPIIQFKTLQDNEWSVSHSSKNSFVVTFIAGSTDTLIYI